MADKNYAILESIYRDYLPYSRIGRPALDDSLARNLHSALPVTEVESLRLEDPIQGGSVPLSTGVFAWYPDGGIHAGSGSILSQYNQAAVVPPLTFSYWVQRWVSPGTSQGRHMAGYSLASSYNGWDTGINLGTDKVELRHYANGAAIIDVVTCTSVITLEWSLITCTVTPSYRAIYFNGKKEAESTANVPTNGLYNAFRFWGNEDGVFPMVFTLFRDFRIWSRTLDDREISQLYARGYAKRDSEVLRPRLVPVIWEAPASAISVVSGFPVVGRIGANPMGTAISPALRLVTTTSLANRIGALSVGAASALIGKVLAATNVGRIGGFGTGVVSAALRVVAGIANVGRIGAERLIRTFQGALGQWIYPNTLERERLTIYGDNARAELIGVTPAGETVLYTLTTGAWCPRRIETIESGTTDEDWRFEFAGDLVDWNVLKYVTKIRFKGATDEEQIYEVLERYNAMKPGRLYHLRTRMTSDIDPS